MKQFGSNRTIRLFHNVRSSVFEKKNTLYGVIEELSAALKQTGPHFDYARRASLYFKKDDLENTLKDYTKAIRLKADHEDHYTMRAEVHRKLGKISEAEIDELRAQESEDQVVDPKDPKLPTNSGARTVSGGVLNGKATNLVKPSYPPASRVVQASGAVNVYLAIGEKGNVIPANAAAGHPLLRASAVTAARESKYSATLLSGHTFKVAGVIIYNFVP